MTVVKNINAGSRSRGRPRAFDRDEALAKAAETFWRLGYEGASIADLTAAMGITPQSLYAAFSSKADLYREALDWYQVHIGASTAAALEEDDGRDVAHAVFHRDLIVLLHVAFADQHAALVFGGEFVHNGSDRAARTAPLGPEVDDDGELR